MPPNVLFVIADDQRPDAIGALGNDDVLTPHLDRLSRSGSFLRPYTTVPVCTPARAELMTGRDAFRNGCRWFQDEVDRSHTFLPEHLSDAGYHTALSGKFDATGRTRFVHPSECGFDETHRVMPNELLSSVYSGTREIEDGQTFRFEEDGRTIEGHSTDVLTRPIARFLASDPDEPWFAYLGLFSPHDPCLPPEEFDFYDPDEVELPPNYLPEHPFDIGDMTIRDELVEEWPRTREAIRDHLAGYYGMIAHHDYHVGRLLDLLEDTGQREDTLVVFTADHGLAKGSHGLMGKQNLYEHSARVPLLLSGPGVPEGERFDRGESEILCGQYDLFPTLCDLLGLCVPDTVEGRSFAGAMRAGGSRQPRDHAFAAYRDVMRMARDDRWKLIRYPHTDHEQLFDLWSDPSELHNLLAEWTNTTDSAWEHDPDTTRAEAETVAGRLRGELRSWQQTVGDPLAEGGAE